MMPSDNPGQLQQSIVRALAVELKVSEDVVRSTRSLREELRMDSIAAVNVAFAIEEEFDIEIEMSESDQFDSVEAICAVVMRSVIAHKA
jgi:acyl carrier protein